MMYALSSATLGFASVPTTDTCPTDLLTYLTGHSSAGDFMTKVLHMADHTTPAATVMAEMMTNFKPIGSHTAHICEATDILYADPPMDPVDGQSGDTNYPYGDIKVLCTVGEYLKSNGYMLVGVPDGMGAMLKDDSTVRIVFQSESYGPMYYESYPFIVNPDGASFTGSRAPELRGRVGVGVGPHTPFQMLLRAPELRGRVGVGVEPHTPFQMSCTSTTTATCSPSSCPTATRPRAWSRTPAT